MLLGNLRCYLISHVIHSRNDIIALLVTTNEHFRFQRNHQPLKAKIKNETPLMLGTTEIIRNKIQTNSSFRPTDSLHVQLKVSQAIKFKFSANLIQIGLRLKSNTNREFQKITHSLHNDEIKGVK